MKATHFDETINYIKKHYTDQPTVGVVLGTGMGALVNSITVEKTIAYNFIPHFPISTVESHFGKLIFGTLGNKKVVAMQGRLHFYEGYSMQEITYPIRIMKLLGVETLFLSNAAGAVNLALKKGELLVINDHLNFLPENPLRGQNLNAFGPRFPDMSAPYDLDLIKKARQIAAEEKISVSEGVYVAVQGPNLETRAEYRHLKASGADVVGMSTVPEVIVANHCGMRVFAISVITDECDPENLHPVVLEDIIAIASATEPKLTQILVRLIQES